MVRRNRTRPVNRFTFAVEPLEQRKLLSGGYTEMELGSFTASGTNPSAPAAQLARDSAGNIFGIATAGGANGSGAIFEIQAGNTTPITIASFPAPGGTPLNPSGLVIDSNGNLYGVTESGGDANGDGTIFKVGQGASVIQTIAQFDRATTGSNPAGNLVVDASGDVFGVTSTGGATGGGTVWGVAAGSSTIATLAQVPTVAFNGIAEQAGVGGLAIDASGDLFGTTTGNVSQGINGTLWELAAGTNAIQTMATFVGGTSGAMPVGAIALTKTGNIYGVTSDGGSGSGTIWQFQPGVGIIPLATLGGPSGGPPVGGVALDNNGNLFGTTSAGGGNTGSGDGSVWELHASSVNVTVIANFTGANGAAPRGGLITDRFGDVFGATTTGGANGGGTVFVMNLGGASTSAAALANKVVKASLPANIVVGKAERGSATVQISNTSKSAVRGNFTINLYASIDDAIDANAIKIGSRATSFNLPAAKSKSISVPLSSFTAQTAGTYTILAQVVDATGTTGAATTGPAVTASAPFVALSEVFSKVKLAPGLVSGQPTKGSATLKVTNHGNVQATGMMTFVLLASPDGALDDAVQIAALTRKLAISAAASASVSVTITSIPAGLAGSDTLIAEVTDPNGAMSSSTYAAPITIGPA